MNKKQNDNQDTSETLINLFPKTTAEKLIWERKMNQILSIENHQLKTELLNKNSLIQKELNFYKSLYDESELLEGTTSAKEKVKHQSKEIKRVTEKFLKTKLELEKQKELYSGLKTALKENLNDFIILLEKTYNDGFEFIDPVKEFFQVLDNYKKNEKQINNS